MWRMRQRRMIGELLKKIRIFCLPNLFFYLYEVYYLRVKDGRHKTISSGVFYRYEWDDIFGKCGRKVTKTDNYSTKSVPKLL